MDIELCSRYLVRVCDSIRELILSRPPDFSISQAGEVCNTFKEFYESLFNQGYFDRHLSFDETIIEIPSFEAEDSLPAIPSDRASTLSKSDDEISEDFGRHSTPIPAGRSNQLSPGKGRPGIARKDKVCARQMRRRKQKSIVPSVRNSAPDNLSDSQNSPLQLQSRLPKATPGRKNTAIYKELAAAIDSEDDDMDVDSQPQQESESTQEGQLKDELPFFSRGMQSWTILDTSFKEFLRRYTEKVLRETPTDVRNSRLALTLSYLKNIHYGVSNNMAHLSGQLISRAIKENTSEGASIIVQEIEDQAKKSLYDEYITELNRCKCPECIEVLNWDDNYNRFFQEGTLSQTTLDMSDRPIHCKNTECAVQSIKNRLVGLSETSLMRDRQFSACCPVGSPPTLACLPPTDIQSCTIRYLQKLMEAVDDDQEYMLPPAYKIDELTTQPRPENLIEIDKSTINLFDGDGGELQIPDVSNTNATKVRFRTKHNDAPEVWESLAMYRIGTNDRKVQLFCAHVGVESLYYARSLVISSSKVFLEMDCDVSGKFSLKEDLYGRKLINLWLQQGDQTNTLVPFVVKMAESGHTFQFLHHGYSPSVAEATKRAIENKAGFRRLPRRTWQFPLRPYDIRRYWGDDPEPKDFYKDDILVPKGEAEMLPNIPVATEDVKYTVRLTSSPFTNEGLCFVRSSTIEGAGMGLFVRARRKTIRKGEFICKYALKSTQTLPATSTRVYAVQTATGWFDAQEYDGTNIGRFANQKGVINTFDLAMENADRTTYVRMDWKVVNDYASSLANARFKVCHNELHIVANQDIMPSPYPTEIFVCYGPTEDYWVPLVASSPEDYPVPLYQAMKRLLTSEGSNWTSEQKERWSGLSLNQIHQHFR